MGSAQRPPRPVLLVEIQPFAPPPLRKPHEKGHRLCAEPQAECRVEPARTDLYGTPRGSRRSGYADS